MVFVQRGRSLWEVDCQKGEMGNAKGRWGSGGSSSYYKVVICMSRSDTASKLSLQLSFEKLFSKLKDKHWKMQDIAKEEWEKNHFKS